MKKATIETEEGIGWLVTTEVIYLGEVSDRYIKELKLKLKNEGYQIQLKAN